MLANGHLKSLSITTTALPDRPIAPPMNYHTFFDLDSIPNPKTRELFKEVLSSYVIENYRSAIVMLY